MKINFRRVTERRGIGAQLLVEDRQSPLATPAAG
jgi:hypothetical protein